MLKLKELVGVLSADEVIVLWERGDHLFTGLWHSFCNSSIFGDYADFSVAYMLSTRVGSDVGIELSISVLF